MNDLKGRLSKEGRIMKRIVFLVIIGLIVTLVVPAFANEGSVIKKNGYTLGEPVDYNPFIPGDESYVAGKKSFDKKEYSNALSWFLKAAEQEHSTAQAYLGMIFASNKYGVKMDDEKRVFWYHKAAVNGNVVAQFNIANLFKVGGFGLPQNSKFAFYWFRKAALQGDAHAQLDAAKMFGEGEGVPQNFEFAYVWANLSAAQGYEPAAKNYRDRIAKHLDPHQLAKAQELSYNVQAQIDERIKKK